MVSSYSVLGEKYHFTQFKIHRALDEALEAEILLLLWLQQKSAAEHGQYKKSEADCNSITGYLEHNQLSPNVCLLSFRNASIRQTNKAGIGYNSLSGLTEIGLFQVIINTSANINIEYLND